MSDDGAGLAGRFDRRRLVHGVGSVALLTVVALFAVTAVPGLVGMDGSYVVRSDSMAPAIEAGDVVFVSDASPETVTEGTVVTFESRGPAGERLVTHRVVEVVERDGRRRYRTKGDANERADPDLVPPSRVVGVVRFHVPLIGHVIAFAQSRVGLAALVVLPAVALVALELYDLVEATAADDESGGGEDQ